MEREVRIPWSEILAPTYRYKILFLCGLLWLHAANSMLAATTLPAAVTDIGGLHLINWAFALYLTASVVSGTAMSLFVHQYGLKMTMLVAAAVYIVGCVVCGTAVSMPVFLVGRALQGIGGGGLVALVYITQNIFFPNRLLPRVIACLSMVWMTSAFFGPLIGGTFATLGMWRGAFAFFALQAGLLLLAIPKLVPTDPRDESIDARKIPFTQLCCLASTILFIAWAGSSYDSVYSPMLVVSAFVTMYLFVALDNRAGVSRMLPETIMQLNHPTSAGLIMTLNLSIALMSFLIYGPILLIRFYDMTLMGVGFVLMFEAIAWGTAAILFSGVDLRFEKRLILTGNAIVLFGLLSNAIVIPKGPLWLLIISVTISNFGFGMMWGYIIRRVVASADEANRKRASSVLPVTQQTGFAIGAAIAGLIANGIGLSDETTTQELQFIAVWLFVGFIPFVLLGNYFAIVFTRSGSNKAR